MKLWFQLCIFAMHAFTLLIHGVIKQFIPSSSAMLRISSNKECSCHSIQTLTVEGDGGSPFG